MKGILNRLSQASSVLASTSEWGPSAQSLCYCEWGDSLISKNHRGGGKGTWAGLCDLSQTVQLFEKGTNLEAGAVVKRREETKG